MFLLSIYFLFFSILFSVFFSRWLDKTFFIFLVIPGMLLFFFFYTFYEIINLHIISEIFLIINK